MTPHKPIRTRVLHALGRLLWRLWRRAEIALGIDELRAQETETEYRQLMGRIADDLLARGINFVAGY